MNNAPSSPVPCLAVPPRQRSAAPARAPRAARAPPWSPYLGAGAAAVCCSCRRCAGAVWDGDGGGEVCVAVLRGARRERRGVRGRAGPQPGTGTDSPQQFITASSVVPATAVNVSHQKSCHLVCKE